MTPSPRPVLPPVIVAIGATEECQLRFGFKFGDESFEVIVITFYLLCGMGNHFLPSTYVRFNEIALIRQFFDV